jgi:hypothetical protein
MYLSALLLRHPPHTSLILTSTDIYPSTALKFSTAFYLSTAMSLFSRLLLLWPYPLLLPFTPLQSSTLPLCDHGPLHPLSPPLWPSDTSTLSVSSTALRPSTVIPVLPRPCPL